ncbi:MAG: hypothetical protein ACI8VL_001776 [Bacteroidia bacterium]|jgi:hypothetical protein
MLYIEVIHKQMHNSMKFKSTSESWYTVKSYPDYISMEILGVYNATWFLGLPKLMILEAKKARAEKLLVNVKEVDFTNLSTMERYFIGEEIANIVSYKLSVAVVAPEEIITKFIETVATNRGINILVVSDLETAADWLKSQN